MFGSPIFQATTEEILRALNSKLTFKISQVNILRKRDDANIPCNNTLFDDDSRFRKEVTKRMGCVPVYWNRMMQTEDQYDICKSPEDMKEINSLVQNISTSL